MKYCHMQYVDAFIKDVQKTVSVDQLYSDLVQPSYVSPFLFGANLLVYSIARSKLAMNIYIQQVLQIKGERLPFLLFLTSS